MARSSKTCLWWKLLSILPRASPHPAEAAIFRRSDQIVSGSEDLSSEILIQILQADWVDKDLVARNVDNLAYKPLSGGTLTYTRSLRALAAIATAYKIMPSATLVTDIFSQPLYGARWIPRDTRVEKDTDRNIPQQEFVTATLPSLKPGSSIDPRIVCKPAVDIGENFSSDNDLKKISRGSTTYALSREQAFACIVMFENRNVNLDPGSLQQVMALNR